METVTIENAMFFTQQPFLIGTYDDDGAPHFATISWVSYTWGPPGCLVISISGATRKKQTTANIERGGMLSATVITPDLLPFAEQNNRATRREGAETAQEIERGHVLPVPLLRGAKWSFECEVIQAVRIGQCDTFFAAFRQVNVREDVQQLEFLDLRAINPVVYASGQYFTVGEHIGAIGDYAT